MKKALIVAVLIAALAVPAAFEDWRADIGITPPITAGLGADEDMNVAFGYPWPIPTASISYQRSVGPFNFGLGIKAYTIIIATAAWPQIYAEYEMDPVIFGLSLGGGLFGFFSPWGNRLESGSVFLPEVSVLFKLGKTFRLGVAGMSILGVEELSAHFPYIIYGVVKFTIPMGKKD